MAAIVWDQVGNRIFETGIDRGVLYLSDRSGVPWNGLRSVVETTGTRALTPLYFDGAKYGDSQIVGDFAGSIAALTYPDEFLVYEGVSEYDTPGVFFKNQALKRFHLSYRSLIGNDTENLDHGYKIHILYNLLAVPKDMVFATLADEVTPFEFGWTITGVPEKIDGYHPISHVIIDSRKMDPYILTDLEYLLYGSPTQEPTLPTLADLKEFFDNWVGITIIDNGDGTWTAQATEQFIEMTSPTEFQIEHANATYLDSDTYEVSTGIDD